MFKKIVKIISALLVFILLFSYVQELLVGMEDDRTPTRIKGFYDKAPNTLDSVFLGSSATYAFLIAPYVWKEYGITIYPFASQAQPIQAAKHLIEEARKTQPDAVYVINISSINGNVKKEWLHVLFDNMPNSLTKLKAIEYVCSFYDYTFEDKLEYVFPIIKYHDRWNDLVVEDFEPVKDEYLTGNYYWSFLKLSKNVGSIGVLDEDLFTELSDSLTEYILDLIEYIEEENVKVQFVVVPQSIKKSEKVGTLNSVVKLIEENGYDVLDMRTDHEELGMDFAVDYYNSGHANMHGALKTSTYLAEYLIDNYDFEDKRGNSDYQDWDEAYMRYYYECLEPNLIEADNEYFNAPLPDKEAWEALQEKGPNM